MAFLQESHIEEADIRYFVDTLGYTHLDGWKKKLLGRSSLREVVLRDRLLAALQKLNPELPESCLQEALQVLTRSRATLEPVAANAEIYHLLRQGYPVRYRNAEGQEVNGYVRIMDFTTPEANDFVVVSQLSIAYQHLDGVTRRPDLLLYVNGLPLVVLELKNATVKVKTGFDKNLTDYRRDIPQLFWYNLYVGISNGIQTRAGAFSAPWEHFFGWVKLVDTAVTHDQMNRQEVESESEATGNRLSLLRLCEGLGTKANLIDYLENFVLYHKGKVKIIAKNHQYLGVNNAVEALRTHEGKQGKLGVFWHTQGSGKSYSMIFFTRKVRRRVPGNWSFLTLTDRRDLDDQIYRNYTETGVIVEEAGPKKANPYRPKDSQTLREALASDRDYLFALIHKFKIDKGKTFPTLSERDHWVVMIDEAHRTQYKDLGENLRLALPYAQYIAFTGTPLLRNTLTKEWFGPYISEYNFAQSIEDGATVPLYYKKNVPRVEQVNEDLVGEAAEILEEENLNDAQREKLDKEYSTLLQVVKREDRQQEIARHIVQHYPYRLDVRNEAGERKPMKAMVICIDKFTAVKMYDLVQAAQDQELKDLRQKIRKTTDPEEKARYQQAIAFMKETKMAVVVSEEPGEEEKFAKEGLTIKPHRTLMDHPDGDGRNIEDYFKDPDNVYRMVFVTAMWLTGFDAPAVSTLYLDKPLKNHTLMQTIARANRVFEGKNNGLVIDYFGVFRSLRKALADYAEGSKGKATTEEEEEFPVQEFDQLLDLLEQAVAEAKAFCADVGADLDAILDLGEMGFKEIELFAAYADRILAQDAYKQRLGLYVNTINSLYDSAKPEIYEAMYHPLKRVRDVLEYLRKVVDRQVDQDEAIARAKQKLNSLLDESVQGMGDLDRQDHKYIIDSAEEIDLSRLDLARLREEFPEKAHKNVQFADLRELLSLKLRQMISQNQSRSSFLARFQQIIDDYNSGSLNLEDAYGALINLAGDLTEEQTRAVREDLTEEQLEIFDLLKKEKLTKEEEKKVKLAAVDLLKTLFDANSNLLIREWHRDRQQQERVKQKIREILNRSLPESYDRVVFKEKVEVIYQHLYLQSERGGGFAA